MLDPRQDFEHRTRGGGVLTGSATWGPPGPGPGYDVPRRGDLDRVAEGPMTDRPRPEPA